MQDSSEMDVSSPFLKWPGGKRWLAGTLAPLLTDELAGTYYEPFLGAGALFLAIRPAIAVLSDVNRALVDFLETVRDSPDAVVRRVWGWSNDAAHFSRVRGSRPRTNIGRAARFLYLNRTCWGGLYRTNQAGQFNVPFGNSGRGLCSLRHVAAVAAAFQGAKLLVQDFSESLRCAADGDVVYADPPYTIKGADNGFIRYNEKLFHWKDQERLALECRAARHRGAFVAVSGLCHADVLALYRGWWLLRIERHSRVARSPDSRGKVSEAVIFSRRPVALKGYNGTDRQLERID